MLKSKEFQPHVLAFTCNDPRLKCPVCGDNRYYASGVLPTKCWECGASFEWKVTVHYKEEEKEAEK